MMGKMAEYISGVMKMADVGMRERQKQRRRRQGRDEVLWEINFGEDCGDDGKWCDEEHDGIDAF